MQKKGELNPCPFCGGLDLIVHELIYPDDAEGAAVGALAAHWEVMCRYCGCKGPEGNPRRKVAIELWNKRRKPGDIYRTRHAGLWEVTKTGKHKRLV